MRTHYDPERLIEPYLAVFRRFAPVPASDRRTAAASLGALRARHGSPAPSSHGSGLASGLDYAAQVLLPILLVRVLRRARLRRLPPALAGSSGRAQTSCR